MISNKRKDRLIDLGAFTMFSLIATIGIGIFYLAKHGTPIAYAVFISLVLMLFFTFIRIVGYLDNNSENIQRKE